MGLSGDTEPAASGLADDLGGDLMNSAQSTNGAAGRNIGTSLLDELFGGTPPVASGPAAAGAPSVPTSGLAALSLVPGTPPVIAPSTVLLPAERGKGLCVRGGTDTGMQQGRPGASRSHWRTGAQRQ